MEKDIINFIPVYPNIFKKEDDIFNPYDTNFYQSIFNKEEFYDKKLTKYEDFPKNIGDLMKDQELISRFFSSYTLYDELLLVHEMGSGKSCSAIGAIENIRSEDGGFKGVLYIAKGEGLINNFVNELIFKCTDGRYIPENYESLSELEKTHRKNKSIKEYYSLNTFETFAKEISKERDYILKKKYNNMIIVIDEVHNLRIQTKKEGVNIYNEFHRFLHVVENCKILLMSGTPMKDSIEEIASVLNLILPINSQLPLGDEFIQKFFVVRDNTYKIKNKKSEELKKYFKGRVSFLRSMESDIDKVFNGKRIGDLRYFNVVQDFMSKFQSNIYETAFKSDQNDRKGVYSESRQASLFVFPDGSYGERGFKKYVIKRETDNFIIEEGVKRKLHNYSLSEELKDAIVANNKEDMLGKLSNFSSKYAQSISNILKAQKEGKLIFLYNEYVQGSGLILFGLILELFGFTKATGKEKVNSEKPRYASLTNLTASIKNINQLVNRFNQPDNVNGKIINVIMGSRKISEGFSFFNIQIEEIQTPWFNYSETSQAIARGYRLGSHRLLLSKGITPKLNIYQRVSIPFKKNIESIDLKMYEMSENKDISIKKVERLLKESAWNCALTYDRNHITGYDNKRECDYMECDYICDGVNIENRKPDYSTYQIYYSEKSIYLIIEEILNIFHYAFRMELESIFNHFEGEYTNFEILSALNIIINDSIEIINMYGFPSYLAEENNIYFLINSLSVVGEISSYYYTKFPHISNPIEFTEAIEPLYYESIPSIIEDIFSVSDYENLRKLINRIPKTVIEWIIEYSILAKRDRLTKNENSRELVLEYFNNYYGKFDDTFISWYLFNEDEILRCLKDNDDIWVNCGEEYINVIDEEKTKQKQELENNPYGYYGQYNSSTNDFCIRDVSSSVIPDKKHQRTSGKRCINWKKHEIIPVIINKLKIPIPDKNDMDDKELNSLTKLEKLSKDDLVEKIRKSKYLGNNYIDENKDNNELIRVLFWGEKQIQTLCKHLRKWFDSKNLLVENSGCGVTGKVKI